MNPHHEKDQPYHIGPTDDSLVVNPREIEAQRVRAADKKRDDEHREQQTGFNRLMVIFTGGLFLTTLISSGISIWQTRVASKSAQAAESAARTANDTLELMRKSGADTSKQVERLIGEQQRTASAMEGSLGRSKATLDASIQASRTDQRAWLGIVNLKLAKEPALNEEIVVTYAVHNSGRTPAINVGRKQGIFIDVKEPPVPKWNQLPDFKSSIIYPSELSDRIRITMPSQKVTEGVIKGYIVDHSTMLYVRIRIEYEDIFGRHHWSETCGSHKPGAELDEFPQCIHGSSVD